MSDDKQIKIYDEEQHALGNVISFEKSLRESCVPEKVMQQVITARVKKEVFDQFVYSPDGKRIALKIAEIVYIWEREQNRIVQVLRHEGFVDTIAFSNDGKQLFVIVNKVFFIQNIESGEIMNSFPIDWGTEKINVISDEIVVIKESVFENLLRLNLRTGEILKYEFHFGSYTISSKRNEIITTNFIYEQDEGGKIRKHWYAIQFWDIETGKQIQDRRIDLSEDELTGITTLPDERKIYLLYKKEPIILIIDQQSRNIRKFDFSYQTKIHMYQPVISPDGKYLLASGSIHREKLYLIETATGRIIKIIDGDFNGYEFSPDGTELAIDRRSKKEPYPDGGIEIWNLTTYEKTKIFDRSMDTQTNFVFSPIGECFVTDASNNDLRIWRIKNGFPQHTLSGHTQFITDTKFSPDGKYLASTGWDRTVRIWDVNTGYCINNIYLDQKPNTLAFSPNGKYLAVTENHYQQKSKIEIIDVRTGNIKYKMEENEYWGTYIEFSKTGHSLIISDRTNSYKLSPVTYWDYETGKIYSFNMNNKPLNRRYGYSFIFSNILYYQDQRNFIIGEIKNNIHVFDIESGEESICFEGHKDVISAMVLHPNKPILISADDHNQIIKWNVETGEHLQNFDGLGPCVWRWRHIRNLAISENEKWLVASSFDGKIHYWDYETGRFLATAYALDQGYLWITPPDEFAPNGWLHTDRPDLISLIEMNKEDQGNPTFIYKDDQRFNDYLQIYNDQDMVMSRLNDWNRYQELLDIRLGNKNLMIDHLLEQGNFVLHLLPNNPDQRTGRNFVENEKHNF
jgi:WD40 repeat protein